MKGNTGTMMRAAALVIALAVVIVVGDRVASRLAPAPRPAGTIIHTQEYQYRLQVNSDGFRNDELTTKHVGKVRVVLLGDSFALGVGVDEPSIWPRVLERRLQDEGLRAEVVNLGQAGGYSTSYRSLAEGLLAKLEPDIVIVTLTQGGDIAQLIVDRDTKVAVDISREERPTNVTRQVKDVVKQLIPTTIRYLQAAREPTVFNQSEKWVFEASQLDSLWAPEQLAALGESGSRRRELLESGTISPFVVSFAMKYPGYFHWTMEVDRPDVQWAVQQLADDLSYIAERSRAVGASVLVASVPYPCYVSTTGVESRADIGFTTTPLMLETNAMDDLIRDASSVVDLPFVTATEQFRSRSDSEDLFFSYDGHFNESGHALFAAALAEPVARLLREDEEW